MNLPETSSLKMVRLFSLALFCAAALPKLAANDPTVFYTQIGTDPTFQELVDQGLMVPGDRWHDGPVHGSTIED